MNKVTAITYPVNDINKESSRIINQPQNNQNEGNNFTNLSNDVFIKNTRENSFASQPNKGTNHLFKDIVTALYNKVQSTKSGNNTATICLKEKDGNNNIIKKPIKVSITPKRINDNNVSYEIYHQNELVGIVVFEEKFTLEGKNRTSIIDKDYSECGIKGNRVNISIVVNCNEKKYSGIGDLADRLAVEHCLKHDIEPNVVFTAVDNSHIAHYLRGNRFVDASLNEKVEEIIKNRQPNERCITKQLGSGMAYIPKERIEKIKKEVQENPSLKGRV